MRIRNTLIKLGLLLASGIAAAQTTDTDPDATAADEVVEAPVYDIELVVFAYVDGIRGRGEDFAYTDTGRDAVQAERELKLADPDELIEGALGGIDAFGEPLDVQKPDSSEAAAGTGLEDPSLLEEDGPRPLEFTPLPPEALRLVEATRRMQINGNFDTLLHTSWRQPVYGPEEETSIDLERLGELPPELGGTASIYVTRFLHLTLDLALADTSAPATGMDTLVYRLDERRKMRSTELHFFDHPRFGALALISRYEPEDTLLENAGTEAQSSTPLPGN